jgi:hypothetical protein
MAERTPPSHQERVDLFYLPSKREISERERRKRRAKSAARSGKREREAARIAAIEPSTPSVPDIDEILASGRWPTAEDMDALTPCQRVAYLCPDDGPLVGLSLFEQQMAVSESLGMDVSDLRRQHEDDERQYAELLREWFTSRTRAPVH